MHLEVVTMSLNIFTAVFTKFESVTIAVTAGVGTYHAAPPPFHECVCLAQRYHWF